MVCIWYGFSVEQDGRLGGGGYFAKHRNFLSLFYFLHVLSFLPGTPTYRYLGGPDIYRNVQKSNTLLSSEVFIQGKKSLR